MAYDANRENFLPIWSRVKVLLNLLEPVPNFLRRRVGQARVAQTPKVA